MKDKEKLLHLDFQVKILQKALEESAEQKIKAMEMLETANKKLAKIGNPFREIEETLLVADNEGTESPYWLLIDPRHIRGRLEYSTEEDPEGCYNPDLSEDGAIDDVLVCIPSCITGPFFCRQDAENYLKARHYEYSKDSYVYCFSGYWSQKYKWACRAMRGKV